ncbi:hypothetical protein AB0M46_07355 [Dactylosporangium sp. NPDC051485]|uniref:hypothetical protein n=1 Tax=Dactylosporangium sp. NPDC051485 TaxID=3154846 RepID=UPI003425DE61
MNVRHVALVLIATALVLSTSACGGKEDRGPSAAPGPAECPQTFTESSGPSSDRSGELVPAGADTALLCVYPFGTGDNVGTFQLRRSLSAAASPDRVTEYLNRLIAFDSGTVVGCGLMGHDQYQIALGYPDGTHAVVRVDYSCGKVSAAGATRRLERADTLLAFWPNPGITG